MKNQPMFHFAAALLAAGSLQAADITGKVIFKGTAAPEIAIPMDPTCGKLQGGAKPTTSFFRVGDGGALADVFVYLSKGAKAAPAPSSPAVLDQVACTYTPYVLGAQTGQKIVVKNSDPVLHNVHPTPRAPGNKEYNKAQLPKGPSLDFSWDNPEVFLRFKCDVHPWMFAYVGLVDHPYFAVTDEKGNFTIKNVPAGEYTIEAVHRKSHPTGKGITQQVKVGSATAKVDFTVE